MNEHMAPWAKMAADVENRLSAFQKDAPEGPFTVWEFYSYGWHFTDYQTLEEAVAHHSYATKRVIHKPIKFVVTETTQ